MNFSNTLLQGLKKIDQSPISFLFADLGNPLPGNDIRNFQEYWDSLPIDEHAEEVPHVRRRRHATFRYDRGEETLTRQPHGTYFQDKSNNRVYGGEVRSFAPIETTFLDRFKFVELFLAECAKRLPIASQSIVIHCHLMRIPVDADGCGLPSPEGIHKDGFDYVSLHMIQKLNCQGGQSIVTRGDNEIVSAPYLNNFFDSLIINDRDFYHAALPIFRTQEGMSHRDTMLASYQADQS